MQGALAEAVRNVHEGRKPATAADLLPRTRPRLTALIGGGLVAGIGVGIGLVLLVVPGLILLVRWSLLTR